METTPGPSPGVLSAARGGSHDEVEKGSSTFSVEKSTKRVPNPSPPQKNLKKNVSGRNQGWGEELQIIPQHPVCRMKCTTPLFQLRGERPLPQLPQGHGESGFSRAPSASTIGHVARSSS